MADRQTKRQMRKTKLGAKLPDLPTMLNVQVVGLFDLSVAVTVTTVVPTLTLFTNTLIVLVSTAKLTPLGTLVYAMSTGVPLLSVATAAGN